MFYFLPDYSPFGVIIHLLLVPAEARFRLDLSFSHQGATVVTLVPGVPSQL